MSAENHDPQCSFITVYYSTKLPICWEQSIPLIKRTGKQQWALSLHNKVVQSNTEWHWACVSMKKIITKIIHLPFQRTTCFKIHTCYVHHFKSEIPLNSYQLSYSMWSLKNKLNSDFRIIVEHYWFIVSTKYDLIWSSQVQIHHL